MIVTLYGLVAVSFMMAMYALEHVHRRFVLAFAVGCLLSSGYGFLSGAWPFGIVEAIWAVIAVRRFRAERKPTLADTEATSSEHSPDAALSDGASVTNHSHTGPRSDTDPEFSERGDRGHRGRRGAKGGVARRGLPVSRGKRLVLLSLFTFLVMIAVGSFMGHHHADPSGTGTGSVTDFLTANGADASVKDVPVSQVGVNQLANEAGHLRVSINFTWLLMTGYLVLFMQVGFAFLVTGLTRAKNAGHMMMMNVAAFAVAFVAYYACGFAFHFGGVAPVANLGGVARLDGIWPHGNAGLLGLRGFFLQSHGTYDVGVLALFLFQVVFMETAGYIIIGAIAERISFAGFLLAELAMGAVIYPVYGNWVWGGGFLAHLGSSMHWGHGSVDFAGSGVVHATGGWAALALAVILGPRIGKFNKDGTPNAFPGHNLGYVVVGTMILLFGWMGFNPGSTLGATDLRISVVAVNTLLSACFGFIVAMAYTNSAWGKPDISMACNGMLAGLVAITAPCAFVAPWAASVIGIVAGLLVCFGVWFFDHVAHVDDPCGAISVHGVNGAWGVLSVGLFADGTYGDKWNGVNGTVKGLFYGDAGQLLAQAAHVVLGFIWAFGITYLIFKIGKQFIRIRVSPQVELEGLDMAEFGAVCYPDFVLAQSAMNPGHAPASAWTDEPSSRTSAPPESVPAGDGIPGGGGV